MSGSNTQSNYTNKRSGKNKSFNKESIDITRDEFDRISDAFKKEEFRKLFLDYCEEIQDPENRKIYEQEITQLEAERGVEVKFVNPEPGFVVKTSADGQTKCFINISQNAEIAKPTSAGCLNHDTGERGLNWSLPMAQTPPREDLDTQGKRCQVFDVIFHSDALYLAQRNKTFHKLLVDTALDAVEREYEVRLDRTNLKFPKLKFKGLQRPTVIRKLLKNPPPEASEPNPFEKMYPEKPTAESAAPKIIPMKKHVEKLPEFNTPKYTIKYQRDVDLSEHTNELDAKLDMTTPRRLVVEIELPMLKSTAECQLDVTEKSIYLVSEKAGAKYSLKLDLPYPVNDKEGNARFDTVTRQLCITLPVIQRSAEEQRNMHNTLLHLNREDSGVESDARDELNSQTESPVEELSDSMEENGEAIKWQSAPKADYSVAYSLDSLDASFLKDTIQYKFPEKFNCNRFDNTLSFILHVRNVQPESITKLLLSQNVHIQFTSIGAGFYPTYYAFYMQLAEDSEAEIENVDIEPWENNIVVNISFLPNEKCPQRYFAGRDIDDLKEYIVQDIVQIRRRMKSPPPAPRDNSLDHVTVEAQNTDDAEHSTGSALVNTTEDEDAQLNVAQKKCSKRRSRKNEKRRSYSESDGDVFKNLQHQREQQEKVLLELQAQKPPTPPTNNRATTTSDAVTVPKSTASMQARKQRSYSECCDVSNSRPIKSILKPFSRYETRTSISDSCSSSIDDLSPMQNSMTSFSQSFDDIPEENISVSLSESVKKTVTFNEHIQKQVFRLDSSILGQRKKNQKRRNRKQRASQRRLSEGDSADYEDDKEIPPRKNVSYFKENINKSTLNKNDQNAEQSQQNSGGNAIKPLDTSTNRNTNTNNNNNNNTTNNSALGNNSNNPSTKKHKICNKTKRVQRLESESSTDADTAKNPMIFDMEI